MTENQGKETLYNFILTQTIANESFNCAFDYLTEKFNIHLDTKYKEIYTANRARKKILEKRKKIEQDEFKKIATRYIAITNRMLKHFDNWESEEKLSKDVNKLYDAIQNIK